MMFRVEQVTEVYAYCDAKDRACRGVALTLRDCELTDALIIVEERDITAHLDPTYNHDNLVMDSARTSGLGRLLADWLQASFQSHI